MTEVLEFDGLPSMAGRSIKAAWRHGRQAFPEGPFAPRLPDVRAHARRVRVDPKRVRAYRRACGLDEGRTLPILFPFVLASPLHAALGAVSEFPYATLGLVHVRQAIVQSRPIRPEEMLTIQAWFGDERPARRGVEFEIVTHVHAGHELVWSGATTALARDAARRVTSRRRPPAEVRGLAGNVIEVPEGMGRRYAKVCGDYNPIHLWRATARLFGFDRPIVHGMWSLARGLGELERASEVPAVPGRSVAIDARFLAPVTLPSRVHLYTFADESGVGFSLRDAKGTTKHVECTLRGGVSEAIR